MILFCVDLIFAAFFRQLELYKSQEQKPDTSNQHQMNCFAMISDQGFSKLFDYSLRRMSSKFNQGINHRRCSFADWTVIKTATQNRNRSGVAEIHFLVIIFDWIGWLNVVWTEIWKKKLESKVSEKYNGKTCGRHKVKQFSFFKVVWYRKLDIKNGFQKQIRITKIESVVRKNYTLKCLQFYGLMYRLQLNIAGMKSQGRL